MSVKCFDYMMDTKTDKKIKGFSSRKVNLSYVLIFERNIENIKKCPECGADIDNEVECSFCKSKIVNNNSKLKKK